MFSQCYIKSIAVKKLNFIMKQRWNLTSPQATRCRSSAWLDWSTSSIRMSKHPWDWVKTQPFSSMETLSPSKKTLLLIKYRLENNKTPFPPPSCSSSFSFWRGWSVCLVVELQSPEAPCAGFALRAVHWNESFSWKVWFNKSIFCLLR